MKDERLYAIPVVNDDNTPFALVERHAFVEFFSRPFSTELFGKKPILSLAGVESAINTDPVVVDVATSIEDVATTIVAAGLQHMVSGFVVTESGKYAGIANGISLLNHITEKKQADLYYLAHYDQITGIPNRMLLNDRIRMACRDARRNGRLVAMIFVDLDRFKQINDTMGHRFGDLLLKAVAERLESCIRGNDTVARLGGDEFAILLQGLSDAGHADMTAQRVVDAFQVPFVVMERDIFITASLGVAFYTHEDEHYDDLLVKADVAMYAAKQSGRNGFRRYAPGQSVHSMEHLTLEAELRHAILRDELCLHYQPQVNVKTSEVIGVEALIRWHHPERGLVPPSLFIGIAEESGLIVDIGNWVLLEACRQQSEWSLQGLPLRMAINISTVQFQRKDFVKQVKQAITQSGIDPGFIELELTENIALHHAGDVLTTLNDLKALGIHLAIDDFGTGFSNLSYLQRFPIDRLKIDQSFVRGIETMPANRSIVQAIVSFAKSLSLETVAEGVETELEYEQTIACACDEVQGYFHAKPMASDEFAHWIRHRDAGRHAVPVGFPILRTIN